MAKAHAVAITRGALSVAALAEAVEARAADLAEGAEALAEAELAADGSL